MDMFADIFTWQRLAGFAVAVAASIAWDLYWGFTWFTNFFDRPVYRAPAALTCTRARLHQLQTHRTPL